METVYDCCANGFKVTTRKTMEDAEQLINKWRETKAFDTSQNQSKCQGLK